MVVAVTTVIYLAKLIQTDSRYAWFETISDTRASPDTYSRRFECPGAFEARRRLEIDILIIPARDPKQCVRGEVWHIISGPADLPTLI